jgi:hypothetical protein
MLDNNWKDVQKRMADELEQPERKEEKQRIIDERIATVIREEQFLALIESVIGGTPALLGQFSFKPEDEMKDLEREEKVFQWSMLIKEATDSEMFRMFEEVFKDNPDYDTSLFESDLDTSVMRRYLERHVIRSTYGGTSFYNTPVKIIPSSKNNETLSGSSVPIVKATQLSDDSVPIVKATQLSDDSVPIVKVTQLKVGAVTGNSLYRLQLEEEDRRKRARKVTI